MFRLLPWSYGTHETTSLAVLALAAALGLARRAPHVAMALSVFALIIVLGRFVSGLSEFYGAGGPYRMALHSAAILGILAVGIFSQEAGYSAPAIGAFFVTFGFALMQLMANVFEIPTITGAMSVATALMVLLLSAAGLVLRAERGVMRVLLNPYASGRQARMLTVIGVLGPLCFGLFFLVVEAEAEARAEALLIVMAIAGFNAGLISLIAVSIERTDRARRNLERFLTRQAFRDGLTGVFNRSMLEKRFQRAAQSGAKYGVPFSFLMFDLDHFKRINDLGGHQLGDRTLRQVALTIRENLRIDDTLARVGGEEFAVILPGADLEGGFEVAERIRKTISEMRVVHGRARLPLTVSVGLAQWHAGESLQGLYMRTDAALYEAKEHGRNRVMLAVADACEDLGLPTRIVGDPRSR
ncbi:GGDEF domain-containing protein [Thioclava atlantica]|uniref:diguanylate cyclase n=1 Tax=Thioclava atlantica TaxID=1317124 RepID=A0A085U051_9RHOB|nr:GGDEF domain-containing protein [Thioclava atlantica]KFE36348.1 diguanylate cyclase [Thioclava atlantica]